MQKVDVLKVRGDLVSINDLSLADYLERQYQQVTGTKAAWPYKHQIYFNRDEARASLVVQGEFPIFDSLGMRHAGYSSPADVGLSLVTVQKQGRLFSWSFDCPLDLHGAAEAESRLALFFDQQNLEKELGQIS